MMLYSASASVASLCSTAVISSPVQLMAAVPRARTPSQTAIPWMFPGVLMSVPFRAWRVMSWDATRR